MKKTLKKLLKVTANSEVTGWLLVQVTTESIGRQGGSQSWLLVTSIF